MSQSGKKATKQAPEIPPTAENSESMALILQIMQQQADERKQQADERTRLHDELRQERKATEERFGLLLQAIQQSGQLHTPTSASSTVQPPALRIPACTNQLSGTPTMAEFSTWRKSWQDFALINRVTQHDRLVQMAALRTHLSQDFQAIFDESITIVASVPDEPTVDEAIMAIQTFIRGMQNIIVDRFHFFTRRQQPGESFEHFVVALRQLAQQADTCTHCIDTQLITLITVGIQDPELQKKLLEIRPAPSLNEVLTVCRAFESACSDQTKTTTTARYAGTKVNSRQHENTSLMDTAQSSPTHQKTHTSGKCYWCGGKPHVRRSACPAKDAVCKNCAIKGHFQAVCQKRTRNPPSDQAHPPQKAINTAHAPGDKHGNWPRSVPIHVSTETTTVKLLAYPDTGADINIIPEKLLPQLGLDRNSLHPADITITAYNGTCDTPIGYFTADMKIGNSTVRDKIYTHNGTQQFLLSGRTCERLGIISFPLHNAGLQALTSTQTPDTSDLNLTDMNPSPDVIANTLQHLLTEFSDVFSDDKTLKPMLGSPMKIHLKSDAQPYAITAARQIAFSLRDQVKKELQDMTAKGIIEKLEDEASDWCHPMVVVRKPNGRIRICVDYTKLNKYVARSVYPMRTPKEAIDSVNAGDRFFSTLDAVQGYWQMELSPESKHLTTFISPEGRFRFLRAPMGLNATGDEYNRRGDIAFADLKNIQKVVDDLLIHTKTFSQHVDTIRAVLHRCRDNGITLSKEKFAFCQPRVKYAGYIVSSTGITADPTKISAISQFPTPTNITELRSFFGLVNQLGHFSSDIAAAALPLRPLLMKNNIFAWSDDHQIAFQNVKAALTQPPILQSFDPQLPTMLQTDASRTRGLGYALLQQRPDGKAILIQCGSRFLSDTESRYAMIELELLAAVWALGKCRLYLLGLPQFKLIIDHRPLIPIINSKGLDEIENPRLLRLREKLLPFTLEAEWSSGKTHFIPDALSRAPVHDPDDTDRTLENAITEDMEIKVNYMAAQLREDEYADNTRDTVIEQLENAAKTDEQYQALIRLIQQGFPAQSTSLPVQQQPYHKIRHDLTIHGALILHQSRIVVPQSQRADILRRLHLSHQGIEKTKRRARQTVYWPGITSDIINTVGTCLRCQEGRPSLPAEIFQSDKPPSRPFQETAADVFEHSGHYYLAYVDRFSGWIEVSKFYKCPSAEMLITALRKHFVHFGIPNKFRSDGGLQFASEAMKRFMINWGVNHVFSAPHFPSSNGLAESAVKSMKALIAASTNNGDIGTDIFTQGLLELHNTPRENGLSPAEMIFGSPLRSCVPLHPQTFAKKWIDTANNADNTHHPPKNLNSRRLQPMRSGDKCWIQDPSTKRWTSIGNIIQARQRNYTVKMPSGRILWRNRRHLRPFLESEDT